MATAANGVSGGGARSSARREEIITVASRLLRRKGLALSLQDIAGELGITYNALYHHFESRDDLLLHCYIRSASLLQAALDDAAGPPGVLDVTGLEKVTGFLRNFVARAIRDSTPPGRYVVALRPSAQRMVARLSSGHRRALMELIEAGKADGSIVGDCDSLVAATWILHTIYWWPDEVARQRTTDQVADQVIALVHRSLAP